MVRVNEVMTPTVVRLNRDDTLCQATTLMAKKGISGAPVVDGEDHLVGILSEADILEFAASKEGIGLELGGTLSMVSLPYDRIVRDAELCNRYQSVGAAKVKDAMNEEVVTIEADEDMEKALETMVRLGFNRLPVVSDGKLVGMVARQDIMVAMCREIGDRSSPYCRTGR
ncbi:MAG: CBS domain-containing protein [Methanomassiliicoccus sp.]|nr:CBS domain-containing protein [Methanomassiliicoccus sp.]